MWEASTRVTEIAIIDVDCLLVAILVTGQELVNAPKPTCPLDFQASSNSFPQTPPAFNFSSPVTISQPKESCYLFLTRLTPRSPSNSRSPLLTNRCVSLSSPHDMFGYILSFHTGI